VSAFHLSEQVEDVLTLMQKYADLPMSLADACLVRMTEALTDPVVLTADMDFRVYRRHGRQIVPCVMPG
jgi:predicted nucleic acid-binding protein